MSQVEPKAKDSTDTGSNGADTGLGMGSTTATLPNSKPIPEGARPLGDHGGWYVPGNPGHDGSNAGRPSDRVRIKATGHVDAEIDRYGRILANLNGRIERSMEDDNPESKLLPLIRESARLLKGLADIGIGQKVTNVVEKDGYHDAASRAYDQSHDKLSFLEALKRELDGIP